MPELVCLAVAQVLLGCHGEHRWLRLCYGRLGHLFPYLPNQRGDNKRLREARWLLEQGPGVPGRPDPGVQDTLRLLDATPVPCAASRTTVKRSALRGWADYGWCPSHSRWYWGFKLYVLSTPDGSAVAWCLASPKLGEREVAMALLDRASLQPGQVLIVDKGLASAEVDRHLASLEAVLVRPDRRDEPARYGSLRPVRQWIERVIDTLKGQLGLEQHGGRTPAGVHTRVAQRLVALAAAIWFNCQLGTAHKRSLVAYDH